MVEKEIDKYIAETLQINKIDFIRIPNKATIGKSSNFSTTAFGKPYICTRYFSDFMFPFEGKTYLVENGIKVGNQIRHKDRKEKQHERMAHWAANGGCRAFIISSKVAAEKMFKEIGVIK